MSTHAPSLKKKRFSLKAWLKSRSFRAGGYSTAAIVIVIAIAVAVNLFAGALPSAYTHLDTTASGLFTLSAQTQQLVNALDTDVTVYWIVQSGSEDDTLGELLDRYVGLSDCLRVEKKDPVVYPNFASQYTSSTLYNNSLIVVSGDRSQYISYTDIYVTDYMSYYTTGSASTEFAGESTLTSAIDYVTGDTLPKAYVLTGHGESDLPSSLRENAESEHYTFTSLSLLTEETVPDDADMVVIYAPQSDISETERDTLLAYLAGGGKMLMVLDYTETAQPNLAAVMAQYGMTLEDGIVLEGDSTHHMRGSNYYLLPDIDSHDITAPIKDGGYYILMPVARGLTLDTALRSGLTVSALLETSSDAYAKLDGYAMTTYDKEDGDTDGPFVLGAAAAETTEGGEETQLVVFTSARMFEQATSSLVAGANDDLFLNALDWMCERASAISIRAKSLDTEYLTVPTASASLLSAVFIAVLPLSFLAVGAVITIRRRKR